MNYILDNLCHYADFLAIPYFLLLTIYFLRIKDKSIIEYILLINNNVSSAISFFLNSSKPNVKIFSQFKDVELQDIDINKDNVIDKKELQLYQNKKSIDSLTPIYIISLICGFTIFVCFMPKLFSFVKNKIKK